MFLKVDFLLLEYQLFSFIFLLLLKHYVFSVLDDKVTGLVSSNFSGFHGMFELFFRNRVRLACLSNLKDLGILCHLVFDGLIN